MSSNPAEDLNNDESVWIITTLIHIDIDRCPIHVPPEYNVITQYTLNVGVIVNIKFKPCLNHEKLIHAISFVYYHTFADNELIIMHVNIIFVSK